MSYAISDRNTITLTRGDSFIARVDIGDRVGNPFTPSEGSTLRFALKVDYNDIKPTLVVDIPIDTMLFELKPEHTKGLPFGNYVYDIQLTTPDGLVDTIIPKGRLKLSEEVF